MRAGAFLVLKTLTKTSQANLSASKRHRALQEATMPAKAKTRPQTDAHCAELDISDSTQMKELVSLAIKVDTRRRKDRRTATSSYLGFLTQRMMMASPCPKCVRSTTSVSTVPRRCVLITNTKTAKGNPTASRKRLALQAAMT